MMIYSGTSQFIENCGSWVIGVTDSRGNLWRELSSCSSKRSCADWLPPQVDVNAFPPGSPSSIQLEPLRYETLDTVGSDVQSRDIGSAMRCAPAGVWLNNVQYDILLVQSPELLWSGIDDSGYCERLRRNLNGSNIKIVLHPDGDLVATSGESQAGQVSIWLRCSDGLFRRALRLNANGISLEFAENGSISRAGGFLAWKVYNVEAIRERIDVDTICDTHLMGEWMPFPTFTDGFRFSTQPTLPPQATLAPY